MAIKYVEKYAGQTTSQTNTNLKDYNKWVNEQDAIGHVEKTYAYAPIEKIKYVTTYKTTYTKDKNGKEIAKKTPSEYGYKYTKPYTFSAHDFGFNIPTNAVVTDLVFIVSLKATKGDVPVPRARFNIYGSAWTGKIDNSPNGVKDDTFNSGIYYRVPNKDCSTTFIEQKYTMNSWAIKSKDGISGKDINDTRFGIDLEFKDISTKKEELKANVCVQWVKCKLKYEIPDCEFSMYTTVLDVENSAVNTGMLTTPMITANNISYRLYYSHTFVLNITIS